MLTYSILLLQIAGGLLSGYLLYFAQQKGKNQADKQDLQKLTKIVEDVKLKNNEELELLKTSLSLITNRKTQIFSEEKDAIIKFFSQLNKWIWDTLNIHLNEFNRSNYTELSMRIIKMRDAYNETNVSFSRVELLITDDNLSKLGHQTIIEVLKLHQLMENLTTRLQQNLSWEKVIGDQITSELHNFQKLPAEMKQFYSSQANENKNERELILKEHNEKRIGLFTPAIGKVHEFKEQAKMYLRS